MTEKMKCLENYAPLGIGVEKQIKGFFAQGIVATVYSMLFFVAYANARSALYEHTMFGEKVLIKGAMIREFSSLTEYVFWGFYIVIVTTLLTAVYNYFYHYQGSKMLYLMKRLPDRGELCRRCVTLPIAGSVILIAWMYLLRMLYFAIYLIFTPSQCLPL